MQKMRPRSTAMPACYYYTHPAVSVFTVFTKVERQYLPVFSTVFLKQQAKQKHPIGLYLDSSLSLPKRSEIPQPYKHFCFPADICDTVSVAVCSFSKQGPLHFNCCSL